MPLCRAGDLDDLLFDCPEDPVTTSAGGSWQLHQGFARVRAIRPSFAAKKRSCLGSANGAFRFDFLDKINSVVEAVEI